MESGKPSQESSVDPRRSASGSKADIALYQSVLVGMLKSQGGLVHELAGIRHAQCPVRRASSSRSSPSTYSITRKWVAPIRERHTPGRCWDDPAAHGLDFAFEPGNRVLVVKRSAGSTFTATTRSSSAWTALYTTPMPPAPSFSSSRYSPSCPAARTRPWTCRAASHRLARCRRHSMARASAPLSAFSLLCDVRIARLE